MISQLELNKLVNTIDKFEKTFLRVELIEDTSLSAIAHQIAGTYHSLIVMAKDKRYLFSEAELYAYYTHKRTPFLRSLFKAPKVKKASGSVDRDLVEKLVDNFCSLYPNKPLTELSLEELDECLARLEKIQRAEFGLGGSPLRVSKTYQ